MRIDWTPQLRGTTPRRDGRGTAAADASFANALDGETAPSATSAPATPMTVDGLFVLQEISDETAHRRRAAQRGTELLDRLDELRLGLLSGAVSRDRLAGLQRLVEESRAEIVTDPQLREILGEIELRVRVELAKLDAVPGPEKKPQ